MNVNAVIIGLAVSLGAYWIIYSLVLWGMLKAQGLNFNWPGLLASSALGTIVAVIPFVGIYAAYVVVVLCIWKVTKEDIWPDVIFTVAVASALMFAIKLFLLGALMGDMRPSVLKERFQSNPDEAVETGGFSSLRSLFSGEAEEDFFQLRGISFASTQHVALIGRAGRNYTLTSNETVMVASEQGPVQIHCDEIRSNSIVLTVVQGEQEEIVELRLSE